MNFAADHAPHPMAPPEARAGHFPHTLDLRLASRQPARLPEATVQTVLAHPIPLREPPVAGRAERVSIITVTWNNLPFTRLCLESALTNTRHPNWEIVVVDNASTDGTPDYLRRLAREHPHVRVVCNSANRGFAPAVNQGLAAATGGVLVLLNNDTLVPPGWLARLAAYLSDPAIGLVGPVTNRTGNEAQIDARYDTYGGFLAFAHERARQYAGQAFDLDMAAMFCVALRREVAAAIGPLDERFEVGLFEDDDYSLRVRAAGLRVVCAEDVFVHHFGQASLGRLARDGTLGRLFHANRERFQAKWGRAWHAHGRRHSAPYRQLRDRIRALVRTALPPQASVLVVSKGDDDLLQLDGRPARHFPQDEAGGYAGCYPAGSPQAIAHLEALRAAGAEYLLFPSTALWWLEHYADFKKHLDRCYALVIDQPDTCLVYRLRDAG